RGMIDRINVAHGLEDCLFVLERAGDNLELVPIADPMKRLRQRKHPDLFVGRQHALHDVFAGCAGRAGNQYRHLSTSAVAAVISSSIRESPPAIETLGRKFSARRALPISWIIV